MMRQKPTETVIADAGEVEHLYITPEMEQSEGSPQSNTTNKNDHGNYTLPEELPAVKEDDLILWALNEIWLKFFERFPDSSHSKRSTRLRCDSCTTNWKW